MVDVYTIAFFLGLGLVFLVIALKQKEIVLAGFASGILFLIFGVLFLSTGIGFPTGDSSNVSYGYINNTINQTLYDSTGAVTGYSSFNTPITNNKTSSTTYGYNTTRDGFTDGLGLLFILFGLAIGFWVVTQILDQRRLSQAVQAHYEEQERNDL